MNIKPPEKKTKGLGTLTNIEQLPESNASTVMLAFYNSMCCRLNDMPGDRKTIELVRKLLDEEVSVFTKTFTAPRYIMHIDTEA